jgi:hypothetical protein
MPPHTKGCRQFLRHEDAGLRASASRAVRPTGWVVHPGGRRGYSGGGPLGWSAPVLAGGAASEHHRWHPCRHRCSHPDRTFRAVTGDRPQPLPRKEGPTAHVASSWTSAGPSTTRRAQRSAQLRRSCGNMEVWQRIQQSAGPSRARLRKSLAKAASICCAHRDRRTDRRLLVGVIPNSKVLPTSRRGPSGWRRAAVSRERSGRSGVRRRRRTDGRRRDHRRTPPAMVSRPAASAPGPRDQPLHLCTSPGLHGGPDRFRRTRAARLLSGGRRRAEVALGELWCQNPR